MRAFKKHLILRVSTLILAFSLPICAPADTAPLAVTDLQGAQRSVPQPAAKATVLFFIAHDCPICLSYAPEMNRLCRVYMPKGAGFYIVYAEPDLSLAAARRHDKAYAYACPAVLDKKLTLSRLVGAHVTPEAVVLSPAGEVIYRGRIDNLYADYGVRRAHATTHDLEDALNAVLAGKPVPHPTTKMVGCFIVSQ